MHQFIHYYQPFFLCYIMGDSAHEIGTGSGNGFDIIALSLGTLAFIFYIRHYIKRIQKLESIKNKGLWIVSLCLFFIPTMIFYWIKIGAPYDDQNQMTRK